MEIIKQFMVSPEGATLAIIGVVIILGIWIRSAVRLAVKSIRK